MKLSNYFALLSKYYPIRIDTLDHSIDDFKILLGIDTNDLAFITKLAKECYEECLVLEDLRL